MVKRDNYQEFGLKRDTEKIWQRVSMIDKTPSYLTHRLVVNLLSITDAEGVQNFSGSQQKVEIPKPYFT